MILIQLKISNYTDNISHYVTILYMPLGSVRLQPEDDWSYGVEGVPDALQHDGDGHDQHILVPDFDEPRDGGGRGPGEQGRSDPPRGTGLSLGEGSHLGVREPPGFFIIAECHHH